MSTKGNLFASLVNKGISDEKSIFIPSIVLLIGSPPKFTFGVSGLSFTFKIVAPNIKFSLKLCSTSTPINVFLC